MGRRETREPAPRLRADHELLEDTDFPDGWNRKGKGTSLWCRLGHPRGAKRLQSREARAMRTMRIGRKSPR